MAKEKYSVGEFERRYLLDKVPPAATNPRPIIDHYINGTRLRLRSVELPETQPDRKLGHKRRVTKSDPTAIMCTSMYLNEDGYEDLSALPSRRLVKKRRTVEIDGRGCSVDVFEEDLAGLILLEVDAGSRASIDAFTPPKWAGVEITHDEPFTGGQLAGTSLADLSEALASVAQRGGLDAN